MSLIEQQRAFRAAIAAADGEGPAGSTGMVIYRNAYRARLLGALETGFERTRRWTGNDNFAAAASHFILTNPPRSWTLDAYGAQFPALLAELFRDDPEVAELAWLEWHMQLAFAAPDASELEIAALAGAGLDAAGWDELRFSMAAGFAHCYVHHDCAALWHTAASDALPADRTAQALSEPMELIVWRKDLMPHYRMVESAEFVVLARLVAGLTLGEATSDIVGEADPERLGGWLAQWLQAGLFAEALRGG
jgi:hypothetical protein